MSHTPSFRLINNLKHCSFVIKEGPFDLNTRWHYHPEIEIMYFNEGSVSGIMGNHFCDLNEGQLVLLGSNFPHVIFEHFNKKDSYITPNGIVIQFRYDFLGDKFFDAPELKLVNNMLLKSMNGILFKKISVGNIDKLLPGISSRKSPRQLLDLLEILLQLSELKDYEILSIEKEENYSELDEARLHSIKKYLYENFKRNIKIEELAALANMTETSFCRYYKSRTLKSFTQTLNEIRVSYACELLNKDYNVADACYDSGFGNPSYFSRTFKKIVGMSPSNYKRSSEMKIIRW